MAKTSINITVEGVSWQRAGNHVKVAGKRYSGNGAARYNALLAELEKESKKNK